MRIIFNSLAALICAVPFSCVYAQSIGVGHWNTVAVTQVPFSEIRYQASLDLTATDAKITYQFYQRGENAPKLKLEFSGKYRLVPKFDTENLFQLQLTDPTYIMDNSKWPEPGPELLHSHSPNYIYQLLGLHGCEKPKERVDIIKSKCGYFGKHLVSGSLTLIKVDLQTIFLSMPEPVSERAVSMSPLKKRVQ